MLFALADWIARRKKKKQLSTIHFQEKQGYSCAYITTVRKQLVLDKRICFSLMCCELYRVRTILSLAICFYVSVALKNRSIKCVTKYFVDFPTQSLDVPYICPGLKASKVLQFFWSCYKSILVNCFRLCLIKSRVFAEDQLQIFSAHFTSVNYQLYYHHYFSLLHYLRNESSLEVDFRQSK